MTTIHRPARLATRAASFRYGGRHHSGIPGGIIPLHPGGFVGIGNDGRVVDTYASCEAFLKAFDPGKSACLLIDAYLPGMSGLELLEKLHDDGHHLPAIMITGNADVPMAVQAMKAGALDFIESA